MSLMENLCAAFNLHVDGCSECHHCGEEGKPPYLKLCPTGAALSDMVDTQAGMEWLRQSGRRAGVRV